MELTVSCGCGRIMRQDPRGPYRFRCGCGAGVRLTGVPAENPSRCPVFKGNRACNAPKAPEREICDPCAEAIASWALADPEIADRLAASSVRREYARRQQVARENHHAERQAELERVEYEKSLTDYNVVYYALVRPGIVKIGTTRHLESRMTALRIESRDHVLAAEPGTKKLERVRHRQFAHLQRGQYREDFELAEELQRHIDATLARYGKPYDLSAEIQARQLARKRGSELPSAKIGSLGSGGAP